MSKLIKAYAITPEKPNYSLLKEFNVSNAVGKLFRGNKKEDTRKVATPSPEDTPDQGHGSELETISTRITQPPAGTVAYSLNLPRSRVKDIFLKIDGGKALVDAIVTTPEDRKKFIPHQGEYLKMADLTANSNDDSILLFFVPTVLSKKFQELKDETVLEEIKKVLSEMLLHRYYVCTFYKNQLVKIQTAVDESLHDAHALVAAFNPFAIYHYRFPSDLTRARDEWDSEHSENAKTKKEIKDLDKQGKLAQARQAAKDKISANGEDIDDVLLKSIVATGNDDGARTSLLINDLISKKTLTRETATEILTRLNISLQSDKIKKLIERLNPKDETPNSSTKEKSKTPEEEDHDRLTGGQAQETYKILGQIIKS